MLRELSEDYVGLAGLVRAREGTPGELLHDTKVGTALTEAIRPRPSDSELGRRLRGILFSAVWAQGATTG